MTDHLLNVSELAKLLKVSERAAYRAVERGEIPCLRVGRLLRFDGEAVLAALRERAERDR